ncbi:MAG: c-type cytochrome [Pseudomonadota bacterium]
MKDPLFGNKVAGAILATLLLFLGLPVIFNTVQTLAHGHHGDHHASEENPFALAYIPYSQLQGAGGPAAEVVEVSLGCLMAEASADRGARRVGICTSCHSLEQGGGNGTGPALWDVMGRQVASVGGFGYTAALQGLEGAWDFEKMDAYLKNSQAFVPGTQMVQRISKDANRADILAYLATLTDGEQLAFPECAPPAEEGAEETEVAAADHGDDAH